MTKVIVLSIGQELSEGYLHALEESLNNPWRDLQSVFLDDIKFKDEEVFKQTVKGAELFIMLMGSQYGDPLADGVRNITEYQFDKVLDFCAQDDEMSVKTFLNFIPQKIDNNDDKVYQFIKRIHNPTSYNQIDFFIYDFLDLNDFGQKFNRALRTWNVSQFHPCDPNAIVYKRPNELPYRPQDLVGRDTLLETVLSSLIDKQENLLLWGIGGVGKSAVASAIAYEWMTRKKRDRKPENQGNNVLWLRSGNAGYDTVLTALVNPVDKAKRKLGVSAPTLSAVLTDQQVSLVVLDDCWNQDILKEIMREFEDEPGVAFIATSRQDFVQHSIHVKALDNESAQVLLTKNLDQCLPVPLDADTKSLLQTICEQVESHPFYLTLVNLRLQQDCESRPLELNRISRMIRERQDNFDFGDNTLPPAHSNRNNFLFSMVATLEDKTHEDLFMACGAFFAPFLTVEMLSSYLDWSINKTISAFAALDKLGYVRLERSNDGDREEDRLVTMHQLLFDFVYSQSDEEKHSYAREVLDRLRDNRDEQFARDELLMPYFANLLGMFACCLAHKDEYAGEDLRQYIPRTGTNQSSFMLQALKFLEKIAHVHGIKEDLKEQADLLQTIGNGYLAIYKQEKALRRPSIQMLQDALEFLGDAKQFYEGQRESERKNYVEVCMSIADCYKERNDHKNAVANYEAAIPYADDPVQASSLAVDLAETFQELAQDHDEEKIVALFRDALNVTDQLTNSDFKVDQLTRIGKAFYKLELNNYARETLASAQLVADDTGYYSGQGCRLCHLSKICARNDEFDEAEGYIDKAIKFTATTQNRRNLVCHKLRLIELHIACEKYEDALINIKNAWHKIEDDPQDLHDYALELYNLWETVINKLRESGHSVDNDVLLNQIQARRRKAQYNIPAVQWAQMSANIYLTQGNYVEAREEYKKALAAAQDHKHPFEEVTAYLQLGLLYQREENPDHQIELSMHYIEKAVAAAGREGIYDLQIFCHRILAHFYHTNDRLPQLETSLKDIFKLLEHTRSEDMEIYQSLFVIALNAGLYDCADEYHSVLISSLPNEMEASAACLKLGFHYFELKAFNHAAMWMARALPLIRGADPNLGHELSYMIASIYASSEIPDGFRLAIEYFHRALEDTNDEQRQMRCYMGLAQVYINTDESRTPEWLRRAEVIAFKSDTEETLETLIQCAGMYSHLEDYDSAIRCINAVLNAATQQENTVLLAESHLRLAKAFQAQERYEEALNHFEIWNSFNPNMDIGCGYCHWAQTCAATGQHDTAIELLERAAVSSRQYENHHNVLCNERRLGSILMSIEPPQKRRALIHLTRAIRAAYESGEQDALVNLFERCGDISFRLGKHEAAFFYLRHWQELQATYPNEVENAACMTCKLGQLYRMRGDYDKAKDLFKSAIEISTRTTEINRNWGCHREELADIYKERGGKAANCKLLQKALSLLEEAREIYVKVDAVDRLKEIEQRIQDLKDKIEALKCSKGSKLPKK